MSAKLNHTAIIMDGNRRWAKQKGLKATLGHEKAARDVIDPIIEHAIKRDIPYLTFWAFSTENWKRDKAEINALMTIFRGALKQHFDLKRLNDLGVKLNIIGDISRFPKDISTLVQKRVNQTSRNQAITVSFALNYGGRAEILRAVKKMLKDKINPSDLNEKLFSSYLDTFGLPDPDLIIRTGGEIRLSGYFPWQAVYAELYFTSTLWPEFTPAEFDQILNKYSQRDRRFGGNTK